MFVNIQRLKYEQRSTIRLCVDVIVDMTEHVGLYKIVPDVLIEATDTILKCIYRNKETSCLDICSNSIQHTLVGNH